MHEVIAIPRSDERYPELLARITDPPDPLYCRGNITLLNSFCIAIVGTRKISDYGKQAAADLAGNLAAGGMTIVSGLALGVDAVAHRAALDAAGATIAVLGSGVDDDTLGPPTNRPLAQRILAENGLIISEYPERYPARPDTFPARNRIISGLSHGVVIVEADRQSGSLITARCALDQNRDVFAVPGSIYWPRSLGTNWLIAQGARPATSAGAIREYYQPDQETIFTGQKGGVSTDDPIQASILALLRTKGPMHLDRIAATTDASPAHVMSSVMLLELKGIVKSHGNGIYSV